jgi:hypothetical protein
MAWSMVGLKAEYIWLMIQFAQMEHLLCLIYFLEKKLKNFNEIRHC